MSKTKLVILASLSALLGFSNCNKECSSEQPDSNYFIFGEFYGMCMGETCVEIFKIENGLLYEDSTDQYPSGSSAYNGIYVEQDNSKAILVSDIMDFFPSQLLEETGHIIGQPDAYDQGGYYVEVKQSGARRYWLIDKDSLNIPIYLQEFTSTLDNYINRIAD